MGTAVDSQLDTTIINKIICNACYPITVQAYEILLETLNDLFEETNELVNCEADMTQLTF